MHISANIYTDSDSDYWSWISYWWPDEPAGWASMSAVFSGANQARWTPPSLALIEAHRWIKGGWEGGSWREMKTWIWEGLGLRGAPHSFNLHQVRSPVQDLKLIQIKADYHLLPEQTESWELFAHWRFNCDRKDLQVTWRTSSER